MKKNKNESEGEVEQKHLFNDQDFVFNVLQTRQSDLGFAIKRCEEAIDKKKESIKQLEVDKKETEKAIEIVKKQRSAVKGDGEDTPADLPSSTETASKEAPF